MPPTLTLLHGDNRDVMRTLPAQSVQAIITSPPYWMKRKYNDPPVVYGGDAACQHEWRDNGVVKLRGNVGTKVGLTGAPPIIGQDRVDGGSNGDTCTICGAWRGELGWEPTPQLFVQHLVEVFAECWRVLRDDGLLFVNLMDTRVGGGRGGGGGNLDKNAASIVNVKGPSGNGLKPKDMALVPQRFVIAMQEYGWYVRSTIIWAKGESFNPFRAGSAMPESARDRPTDTHEYIFMFSKSPRYYSDMAAVAEAAGYPQDKRRPVGSNGAWEIDGRARRSNGGGKAYEHDTATRNLRSVWTLPPAKLDGDVWRVNTRGTSVKHYATWCSELAETMIRMSTSEHGVCSVCGAGWERVQEKTGEITSGGNGSRTAEHNGLSPSSGIRSKTWAQNSTVGWRPTCDHADAPRVPATVLDPFGGIGTTGRAAHALGRNSICIELKQEYHEIAEEHRPLEPLFA